MSRTDILGDRIDELHDDLCTLGQQCDELLTGGRALTAAYTLLDRRVRQIENGGATPIAYDALRVRGLEAECKAKSRTIQQLQDQLAQARQIAQAANDNCRPTWVDSKGRTHFIDEMPTAYLVNVRELLVESFGRPGRFGTGLIGVIQEELDARDRN